MPMGPEIAVYIEPHEAVYIEIPKVACTSIKVALARMLSVDLVEGNPHVSDFPSTEYNLSKSGYLYPGLFSFAFVRNPWDRLVSCYRDKICLEVDGFTRSTIRPGIADCLARFDSLLPSMSFDEFVRAVASIPDSAADDHFRSQYTFVSNLSGEVAVDFIGRYESIVEDLSSIQRHVGMELSLPWLQAASSKHYRDYYDSPSRNIVADRFGTDIELFEYDF